MRQTRLFILFGTLAVVMSVNAIIMTRTHQTIQSHIDNCFDTSIWMEYYHRKDTTIQRAKFTDPLTKVKEVRIRSNNGVRKYTFPDSIALITAHQLTSQHTASRSNTITPDAVSRYFKQELQDHGITDTCGILINNKEQGLTYYSHNDSLTCKQATYTTPTQTLDFDQLVSIQGWVDYGWSTLFAYMPNYMGVINLLGVILLMAICMYKPQKAKQPVAQPSSAVTPSSQEEENSLLPRIDLDYGIVVIEGKKYPLPKMTLALFNILVQHANQRVSQEEIQNTLWPNTYTGKSNLHTQAHNLRNFLKEFPQFELITFKGDSYQLIMHDDSQAKE